MKSRTFKAINSKDIQSLQISVPSLKEQQKIADCLSSFDELISIQSQKVELLKTYKKGLMQQLFPKEGETTPRLRFPEFRDAGEWEEKRISEIFKVTRGKVLAVNQLRSSSESDYIYPVFSSQTKNDGLVGYYTDWIYKDAITWTTDGYAGEVKYRDGKFYCTNVCGVLLSGEGFANQCIAEILNGVAKKYVAHAGIPKLMNNVMATIKIPFPSLKEQQKIADCLSSFDELISVQSQKVELLKIYKKGLMQQLFPSPDGVCV